MLWTAFLIVLIIGFIRQTTALIAIGAIGMASCSMVSVGLILTEYIKEKQRQHVNAAKQLKRLVEKANNLEKSNYWGE